MKNKSPDKSWSDRSPAERARIERDRSAASYASPFSGKNQSQRRALSGAFIAMMPSSNR
jgi:hypothetical protein